MSLQDTSAWLSATPLSLAIQTAVWAVPLIQSIHILAICVIAGSALVFDLRLAGVLGRDVPVASVAGRYLPWMWTALAVLLLSGSALIVGEPDRTLFNWVFWTKMALVLSAALLTFGVQLGLRRDPGRWDQALPFPVRLAGVLGLMIWIAVIVCGRWIAYVV